MQAVAQAGGSAECAKTGTSPLECNISRGLRVFSVTVDEQRSEDTAIADPTDESLVRLTREGDADAYGTLVARYQGHVYGLAYSLVENWAEAQDIAQETFIRAYLNLDQLQNPARFAAWLRRVTFSITMNWVRAYRPALFKRLDGQVDLDSLEIPDFRPGPPEVAEKRELAEVVLRAVNALPPKYRVPLTMFHLDGLSYEKVADFLDIPLGTAKALIHRARAKLRTALAPYVAEEATPMVQEVFNEHKLPAGFAQKVLENVPKLAWGTNRECTFLGALEAALAVTEHPYAYTDLMGWSGMAFRARWMSRDEEPHWCPSCAVAEMDEEIAAVQKATGWPLRVEFMDGSDTPKVKRLTKAVTTDIDAAKPVLAYGHELNMAVVYGYEKAGKTLLLRDYQGDEPLKLPPAKLGFLMLFLGDHGKALSRRQALLQALRIAVQNWEREKFTAGPGEYWYGRAALVRWAHDVGRAMDLEEGDRRSVCGIGRWVFVTLRDARGAVVAFLRENKRLLTGAAASALKRAADAYEKENEMFAAACADGNLFTGDYGKWSAKVRKEEIVVLNQACEIEETAIAAIKEALAAAGA
jgi:RNA polymerase sigma-70 factor (ECF subfamily)